MRRPGLDLNVLSDPSWWHWLATIALLSLHLAGAAGAIEAAMGLCAVMAAFYFLRVRSFKAFPVQVRLAYLALLALGLLPALGWIHWVPLAGTTARVTAGYCLLSRLLALLPWNREVRLSLTLVRQTALAASRGGVLAVAAAPPAVGTCSLRGRSCSLAARRVGEGSRATVL